MTHLTSFLQTLLFELRSSSARTRLRYASTRVRVDPSARVSMRAVLDAVHGGTITIGPNVLISRGARILTHGGDVEIGADVSINDLAILYGHGGLRIGRGTRIAAQALFIPSNHVFADPDVLIKDQGETSEGIDIGEDVWVGAGATILDGVRIGRGAVVAAGAVVVRSVEPYTVVGGVPARVISHRGPA